MNIPVITLMINVILYFISDTINQYFIFKTAIKHSADIVYANDFDTLIAGYFASRKKRAKFIYDSHELWSERANARNNIYMKSKRIIEYYLEWFFINRCDLVITVSDGIADELVKRYHIKRPLVIRNLDTIKGLPSEERIREIRSSLDIPEDCTLIVYQGGLSESRGISELIEAFDLLPEQYHLLLMGWDKCSISLNNSRVHYLGTVNESYLHTYSSIADIGIHPMKTKYILNHILAFPNKFSQYMNAGLALVLYRSPESVKIISQCNCGKLLDLITPEEIAIKIKNMNNSNIIDSMKENSRKCFLKYYNWDIDRDKLLDAILEFTDEY